MASAAGGRTSTQPSLSFEGHPKSHHRPPYRKSRQTSDRFHFCNQLSDFSIVSSHHVPNRSRDSTAAFVIAMVFWFSSAGQRQSIVAWPEYVLDNCSGHDRILPSPKSQLYSGWGASFLAVCGCLLPVDHLVFLRPWLNQPVYQTIWTRRKWCICISHLHVQSLPNGRPLLEGISRIDLAACPYFQLSDASQATTHIANRIVLSSVLLTRLQLAAITLLPFLYLAGRLSFEPTPSLACLDQRLSGIRSYMSETGYYRSPFLHLFVLVMQPIVVSQGCLGEVSNFRKRQGAA